MCTGTRINYDCVPVLYDQTVTNTYVPGGFYFDKTPSWLDWTKQVSYINHAYTLLLKIQFPGGQFPCGGASPQLPSPIMNQPQQPQQQRGLITAQGGELVEMEVDRVCTVRGAGLLTFVDLEDSVGVNVGALVTILVGMRLLTYFALRFLSLKP